MKEETTDRQKQQSTFDKVNQEKGNDVRVVKVENGYVVKIFPRQLVFAKLEDVFVFMRDNWKEK